jgi:tRNA modification GTPase
VLVSPQRGTTRDYVTAELSIDGLHLMLVDTAGVDEGTKQLPPDTVDIVAQRLARQTSSQATLRLECREQPTTQGFVDVDRTIVVFTKADLHEHVPESYDVPSVATSSFTGVGLDRLAELIRSALVGDRAGYTSGVIATTAARCGAGLRQAADALERALELTESPHSEELIAAEARFALLEIGKVVGAVYTDDVLDRIFSKFCIGK